MLILAKAILAMMIGFILSVIFGFFFIPILKKLNIINIFFTNKTQSHDGLSFIPPSKQGKDISQFYGSSSRE